MFELTPTKLMFWCALGVSLLIKGPIGVLVAALTMIALSNWDRDRKWIRGLGWGWGLPLLVVYFFLHGTYARHALRAHHYFTHDEQLMAAGGRYAELFALQAEGYR